MKFAALALSALLATSTNCVDQEEIDVLAIDPLKCMNEHCKSQLDYVVFQDSYKYCQRQCGSSQSCWNSCFPTIQSQAAYDLAVCAEDYQCLDIPQEKLMTMIGASQKCIQSKCGYEMLTLKRDKLALKTCFKSCKTNQQCWDRCMMNQATTTAMQVNQCAQRNGCLPAPVEDTECFMEKCAKQYNSISNPNAEQIFYGCGELCAFDLLCLEVCIPAKVRAVTVDAIKCSQANHCLKV